MDHSKVYLQPEMLRRLGNQAQTLIVPRLSSQVEVLSTFMLVTTSFFIFFERMDGDCINRSWNMFCQCIVCVHCRHHYYISCLVLRKNLEDRGWNLCFTVRYIILYQSNDFVSLILLSNLFAGCSPSLLVLYSRYFLILYSMFCW